jgi:hypothetical protein
MTRLFASYSRKDEAAVRKLIADLQRAHLSVWYDQALHGGDPWWQDILRRIRECDVFLFALSKNSLASKPCLAELSYARALGLPVLPMQVGEVGNLRLTPVADIQVIDYRKRTVSNRMALIETVQDAATKRRPLPDPLPEPPPVPFEYLLRLGSAIGAAQLTPDQQGDFIRQLRECLETEDDEGVKDDARELLRALRRRPDITYRNAAAVDLLLTELNVSETRETEVGGGDPVHSGSGRTSVPPTPADGQAPESEADVVDSIPDRQGRRTAALPAAPRRRERSRLVRRLLVSGVLLIVLAALATSVLLFRSANTTMVHAEAANEPGDYPPFVPQPAAAESGQRPTPPPDETVSGNTPGLYGGTGTNTCDAEAIADYLEAHPDMATAWASARRGLQPNQIPGYLTELTPLTLRTDTAVTNHGYRNGGAIAFQSVLQAGTAVLVDHLGVPRVRCACGNPLELPEPPPRARYEESPWPGFLPQTVTVIKPAPAPVTTFVVLRPDTDEVIARPRGTRGDQDHPAAPAEREAAREFSVNRGSGSPGGSPPGGSPPGDTPPGDTDGTGGTDTGDTPPGDTDGTGGTDTGDTPPGDTPPGDTGGGS